MRQLGQIMRRSTELPNLRTVILEINLQRLPLAVTLFGMTTMLVSFRQEKAACPFLQECKHISHNFFR